MKLLRILASLLLLGAVVDQAPAVPYASQIKVSSTVFSNPLTISYRLNEAADSVSIQIMNGASPVATFAGTTTQGANQVNWDGTTNNAGGTAVANGNYAVKITANKNRAAWEEIASQRSLGNFGPANATYNQVFNGFSPNDFLFVTHTDSAAFGSGLAMDSYNAVRHVAAITFNSDLSTSDSSDGFNSRIFKYQFLENLAAGTIAQSDVWMGSPDPDNPHGFYFTGQRGGGATALYYGNLDNPEFVTNSNSNATTVVTTQPRHVLVAKEGSNKYAYFVEGNSLIKKVAINGSNQLVAPVSTITGTFGVTNQYGKALRMDNSGNLYFISKSATNINQGVILRWNASQITGIPPSPLITDTNAVWKISTDTSMGNLMGMAITPSGDCYALLASSAPPTGGRGIYYVGNTSSPTLTKTLTVADRVVNLNSVGDNSDWVIGTTYGFISADPAGNVLVGDRSQEQLRLYAPPGSSSQAITAPNAQKFTIGGSDVANWSLY